MLSFSHPRTLYFTRIGQLALAIGYLILICWCGVHRRWWTNITAALAIGVITSIFTLVVGIHGIWNHHRRNPFVGHGKGYAWARLGVEAFMILMWIASVALMLRPKGVKPGNWNATELPPDVEWDIGIAFDFVEIISFMLSLYMVFREDRTAKVGGSDYV